MSLDTVIDALMREIKEIDQYPSKIATNVIERLSKILLKMRDYKFESYQKDTFLFAAFQFFLLLVKFSASWVGNERKALCVVKSSLEAFLIVVDKLQLHSVIIMEFTRGIFSILQQLEPVLVELLHVFLVLINKSKINLKKVAADVNFKLLVRLIRRTNNFRLAAVGVELLLRFKQDAALNAISPGISTKPEKDFYSTLRKILNEINGKSDKMFSVTCSSIVLDAVHIVDVVDDFNWLDIDLTNRQLSFFCTSRCFESFSDSGNLWLHHIVNFCVDDILNLKFILGHDSMVLTIKLRASGFNFWANVQRDLVKTVVVSVLKTDGRFINFVTEVAPALFPQWFTVEKLLADESLEVKEKEDDETLSDVMSPVIGHFQKPERKTSSAVNVAEEHSQHPPSDDEASTSSENYGNCEIIELTSDDEDEPPPNPPPAVKISSATKSTEKISSVTKSSTKKLSSVTKATEKKSSAAGPVKSLKLSTPKPISNEPRMSRPTITSPSCDPEDQEVVDITERTGEKISSKATLLMSAHSSGRKSRLSHVVTPLSFTASMIGDPLDASSPTPEISNNKSVVVIGKASKSVSPRNQISEVAISKGTMEKVQRWLECVEVVREEKPVEVDTSICLLSATSRSESPFSGLKKRSSKPLLSSSASLIPNGEEEETLISIASSDRSNNRRELFVRVQKLSVFRHIDEIAPTSDSTTSYEEENSPKSKASRPKAIDTEAKISKAKYHEVDVEETTNYSSRDKRNKNPDSLSITSKSSKSEGANESPKKSSSPVVKELVVKLQPLPMSQVLSKIAQQNDGEVSNEPITLDSESEQQENVEETTQKLKKQSTKDTDPLEDSNSADGVFLGWKQTRSRSRKVQEIWSLDTSLEEKKPEDDELMKEKIAIEEKSKPNKQKETSRNRTSDEDNDLEEMANRSEPLTKTNKVEVLKTQPSDVRITDEELFNYLQVKPPAAPEQLKNTQEVLSMLETNSGQENLRNKTVDGSLTIENQPLGDDSPLDGVQRSKKPTTKKINLKTVSGKQKSKLSSTQKFVAVNEEREERSKEQVIHDSMLPPREINKDKEQILDGSIGNLDREGRKNESHEVQRNKKKVNSSLIIEDIVEKQVLDDAPRSKKHRTKEIGVKTVPDENLKRPHEQQTKKKYDEIQISEEIGESEQVNVLPLGKRNRVKKLILEDSLESQNEEEGKKQTPTMKRTNKKHFKETTTVHVHESNLNKKNEEQILSDSDVPKSEKHRTKEIKVKTVPDENLKRPHKDQNKKKYDEIQISEEIGERESEQVNVLPLGKRNKGKKQNLEESFESQNEEGIKQTPKMTRTNKKHFKETTAVHINEGNLNKNEEQILSDSDVPRSEKHRTKEIKVKTVSDENLKRLHEQQNKKKYDEIQISEEIGKSEQVNVLPLGKRNKGKKQNLEESFESQNEEEGKKQTPKMKRTGKKHFKETTAVHVNESNLNKNEEQMLGDSEKHRTKEVNAKTVSYENLKRSNKQKSIKKCDEIHSIEEIGKKPIESEEVTNDSVLPPGKRYKSKKQIMEENMESQNEEESEQQTHKVKTTAIIHLKERNLKSMKQTLGETAHEIKVKRVSDESLKRFNKQKNKLSLKQTFNEIQIMEESDKSEQRMIDDCKLTLNKRNKGKTQILDESVQGGSENESHKTERFFKPIQEEMSMLETTPVKEGDIRNEEQVLCSSVMQDSDDDIRTSKNYRTKVIKEKTVSNEKLKRPDKPETFDVTMTNDPILLSRKKNKGRKHTLDESIESLHQERPKKSSKIDQPPASPERAKNTQELLSILETTPNRKEILDEAIVSSVEEQFFDTRKSKKHGTKEIREKTVSDAKFKKQRKQRSKLSLAFDEIQVIEEISKSERETSDSVLPLKKMNKSKKQITEDEELLKHLQVESPEHTRELLNLLEAANVEEEHCKLPSDLLGVNTEEHIPNTQEVLDILESSQVDFSKTKRGSPELSVILEESLQFAEDMKKEKKVRSKGKSNKINLLQNITIAPRMVKSPIKKVDNSQAKRLFDNDKESEDSYICAEELFDRLQKATLQNVSDPQNAEPRASSTPNNLSKSTSGLEDSNKKPKRKLYDPSDSSFQAMNSDENERSKRMKQKRNSNRSLLSYSYYGDAEIDEEDFAEVSAGFGNLEKYTYSGSLLNKSRANRSNRHRSRSSAVSNVRSIKTKDSKAVVEKKLKKGFDAFRSNLELVRRDYPHLLKCAEFTKCCRVVKSVTEL